MKRFVIIHFENIGDGRKSGPIVEKLRGWTRESALTCFEEHRVQLQGKEGLLALREEQYNLQGEEWEAIEEIKEVKL